jgi:hypothetical protein
VQAVVEGIGVPVAIGVTGVLLLALNLLGVGTAGVIVFGLVLGTVWTGVAVVAYRSYAQSLAGEMQLRSLSAVELDADDGATAVRTLLRSEDLRDVRLGLDLLAGLSSPAPDPELRRIAEHGSPELRLPALALLGAHGDERAAGEAGGMLVAALASPDLAVRAAALDTVNRSAASSPEIVQRVVAALAEPRLAGRATAAIRRLGTPTVPVVSAALAAESGPRSASLVRAAAALASDYGIESVAPALEDPDRAVVLTALEALEAAGARDLVAAEDLDCVLFDAASVASRSYAARAVLAEVDPEVTRALAD